MKVSLQNPRAVLASLIAGASVLPTMALAAVPEAVTTELTTAKVDVGTLCAAAFAIVMVIAVFKWFRRAAH